MFSPGTMKFWNRLLSSVAVLGLVTLGVYLRLANEMASSHLQHHHLLMLRGVDERLRDKSWGYEDTVPAPEICELTTSGPPHYANISTYDLYYHTQFNVRSSGEWEMITPTQEYHRASVPPKLTVILVPHSHNDPGWLKTVNEYYADHTRHILNNMVAKLTQYPNLTFIWTETLYFAMWWHEIEDAVKVHVRRLIRRRQLEITLGGWVMPDEAGSHYQAVIDQLIEGHQWVWENLGVRPENSWSIDPFGYSSTMAYLWKKSGMSNMVLQRVHQAVKASLVKQKALEFYWRQMWDAKGTTDIFCHVMPFMLYSIKYTCGPNQFSCRHFDFREIPGELSELKDRAITPENIEYSADMLYHQYRTKAYYFRYNTILVPIGDDFRYDKAEEWDQQYKNYEKLIQVMNSRPEWNVQVKWGTLHDYFRQVKKENMNRKSVSRTEEFPVLSGDFFPYSDRDMDYWTGYYSTRPFDKSFGRNVQAILQAVDILNTLHYAFYKRWGMNPDTKFAVHSSLLQQARRSLGLFLHHDAITGTAKAFVAEDYEQYLLKAFTQSQEVIKQTLQSLLSDGKVETPLVFHPEIVIETHKDLPRKQVIPVQESGTTVAFFNPLSQQRQQIVHLLVNTQMVEVVTSSQKVLPCQIRPVWSKQGDAAVLDNVFELTFLVEFGPFSITSYMLYKREAVSAALYTSSITAINCAHQVAPDSLLFHFNKPQLERISPIIVDNKVIELTFDPRTGSLLQVKDLETQNVTILNISFQAYKSQGSGAYLFSPKGPASSQFLDIPIIRISQGPLTTSVEITFDHHLTQIVTLHHHPAHLTSAIFLENTLNIESLQNKEVIMRFNTDINNMDLTYFTDQNGFQFIRRRTSRNLPTEANYYPMTSALLLEDTQKRLTLLSAQPHGVSCLDTGEVEVMLDRQLIYDDNRGMGEGVTDIKTTISRFVIMVEHRQTPASSSPQHHSSMSVSSLGISDILQHPILAFFTTVDTAVFFRSLNPFPHPLPCDLTVANFRSLVNSNLNYNGTSIHLHRRGYDCSFPFDNGLCSLSDSGLTFEKLFQDFPLSTIQETTLTHTSVKRTIRPTDRISIAPMEITSFHFHF